MMLLMVMRFMKMKKSEYEIIDVDPAGEYEQEAGDDDG